MRNEILVEVVFTLISKNNDNFNVMLHIKNQKNL